MERDDPQRGTSSLVPNYLTKPQKLYSPIHEQQTRWSSKLRHPTRTRTLSASSTRFLCGLFFSYLIFTLRRESVSFHSAPLAVCTVSFIVHLPPWLGLRLSIHHSPSKANRLTEYIASILWPPSPKIYQRNDNPTMEAEYDTPFRNVG